MLKLMTIVAALVSGGVLLAGPPPEGAPVADGLGGISCTPCHTSPRPTPGDPSLRSCPRGRETAVAPPEMVILDDLEDLYLPVPFDHRGHADMAAMTGGCEACHHHTPDGTDHPACRSCHPRSNGTDELAMPGLKGAYHRQCMGCHRAWSHSTACSVCHLPKTRATAGAEGDRGAVPAEVFGPGHPPLQAQPAFVYRTSHETSPMVTFRHADHVERFGVGCIDCHQGDSCSRCHDEQARHQELDFLTSCCNCHGQSNCGFCHKTGEQSAVFDHATSVGWPLEPNHAGMPCARCHGDTQSFVTPSPNCDDCHGQTAAGRYDHRAAGRDRQCLDCHADVARTGAGPHHEHPAFTQGCGTCHDPYGADTAFFLRQPVPELCISCHGDVGQCLDDATTVHWPTRCASSCMTCHQPHASQQAHLLKKTRQDLCLGCHSRPIDTADGRHLPDMAARLSTCPDHHGPIRSGDCTACHQPHAAKHERLLRASYPSDFYFAFDRDGYGLCFGCHDEQRFEADSAVDATGFRDGPTNLHLVHVNRKKGRTCRACHDVHASSNPFHIRDDGSFDNSQWSFPLGYELADDGGRCAPGCHVPKGYHRTDVIAAATGLR